MAHKKSKTSRLSYIEETPKHHKKLEEVARASVRESIASAKEAGLYITYARGTEIVREYPDGKIEVIGNLKYEPLKVEPGKKLTLS